MEGFGATPRPELNQSNRIRRDGTDRRCSSRFDSVLLGEGDQRES